MKILFWKEKSLTKSLNSLRPKQCLILGLKIVSEREREVEVNRYVKERRRDKARECLLVESLCYMLLT